MSPHPPFEQVQVSRPAWRENETPQVTQTRKPDWKMGQGAADHDQSGKKWISFDPHEEGRNAGLNYKVWL